MRHFHDVGFQMLFDEIFPRSFSMSPVNRIVRAPNFILRTTELLLSEPPPVAGGPQNAYLNFSQPTSLTSLDCLPVSLRFENRSRS